jgi:hypothetical protein
VRHRVEGHHLSIHAGGDHFGGARVIRDTTRLGTDAGLVGDRAGGQVDAQQLAARAQRDVRSPGLIERHAARLAARRQLDRADVEAVDVQHVHGVAVRVGGDRPLAVA